TTLFRSQRLLSVVNEGDQEVRCAGTVVLGHPQAEPLGVPADAVDHQRRVVLLEAEHARAQPVALEPRQRSMADAARLGDVARLAGDLAPARLLAGDDDGGVRVRRVLLAV